MPALFSDIRVRRGFTCVCSGRTRASAQGKIGDQCGRCLSTRLPAGPTIISSEWGAYARRCAGNLRAKRPPMRRKRISHTAHEQRSDNYDATSSQCGNSRRCADCDGDRPFRCADHHRDCKLRPAMLR